LAKYLIHKDNQLIAERLEEAKEKGERPERQKKNTVLFLTVKKRGALKMAQPVTI
jgi:hypothetical protein